MLPIPPLFADIDWIQIVIVIFFLAGPLLSQLGGGKKKAKQPGQPQRRPPQAPPGRPQGGGQAGLQKEIDDFLRQAQAGRGGQQKQRQQRPPQQRPSQQRPPQQRPPRPQAPPRRGLAAEGDAARRRARQQALKKKKAEQLQQAPRRESVAEHVDAHIKSRPVSDHSKQLGKRVALADENVEEHLHEVFDHEIGDLSSSTAAISDVGQGTDAQIWENLEERRARNAAAVDLRTADIARMMRDPVSMRQAIIIGEILKPPKSDE